MFNIKKKYISEVYEWNDFELKVRILKNKMRVQYVKLYTVFVCFSVLKLKSYILI